MRFIRRSVLSFAETKRREALDAKDRVKREIARRGIAIFALSIRSNGVNTELDEWPASCTSPIGGNSLVVVATRIE
jgi:hypothetical protein